MYKSQAMTFWISLFSFRGSIKEMPQCQHGKRIPDKGLHSSHDHASYWAYHCNHNPFHDYPFTIQINYTLKSHIYIKEKTVDFSGKIKIFSASHPKYKTAGNICFLLFHLKSILLDRCFFTHLVNILYSYTHIVS